MLKQRIAELIEHHGSLRAAARVLMVGRGLPLAPCQRREGRPRRGLAAPNEAAPRRVV